MKIAHCTTHRKWDAIFCNGAPGRHSWWWSGSLPHSPVWLYWLEAPSPGNMQNEAIIQLSHFALPCLSRVAAAGSFSLSLSPRLKFFTAISSSLSHSHIFVAARRRQRFAEVEIMRCPQPRTLWSFSFSTQFTHLERGNCFVDTCWPGQFSALCVA